MTKANKQTKKYKFTKETKEFFGRTLHRIVATRNFGDVKKGDLGGFIETEGNLSHDGFCWVYDNARVSGNAQVFGKARVYDNAWVSENASVYGKAEIKDQTHLTEGNHNDEVVKETQTPLTKENAKLRQENEELKAKLKKLQNNVVALVNTFNE